jgi:hypothetical protein
MQSVACLEWERPRRKPNSPTNHDWNSHSRSTAGSLWRRQAPFVEYELVQILVKGRPRDHGARRAGLRHDLRLDIVAPTTALGPSL